MGSAGVSAWTSTGILSFHSAPSAPSDHRQLRWLNPISEIAEPFPRLWRGDCPAEWGQTTAGCPGRLWAAHSSHSAQIHKPTQWERNKNLWLCFTNSTAAAFYIIRQFKFLIYNNFLSLQASWKDLKVNSYIESPNAIMFFIHVPSLSENSGIGFVAFNGLEVQDRKLIDSLPVFSLFS